jgi:diguanylate cyclase (GGDEF)-like protein
MMAKLTAGKQKKAKHRSFSYSSAALLFAGVFLLQVILRCVDFAMASSSYIDVSGSITAELIRSDGSSTKYEGNSFDVPREGDTLILTVPLDSDRQIKNSALSFFWYNAAVTVSDMDGNVLYSDGRDSYDSNRLIGDLLCIAPIPEKDWGNDLTITIEQLQNCGMGHVHALRIQNVYQAIDYPIVGHSADFALLISFLFVFIILGVIFGVYSFRYRGMQRWFWFSMFIISVAIWILGYSRLFYVISDSVHFCSRIEYFMLYVIPITALMYFGSYTTDAKKKGYIRIWVIAHLILMLTACCLAFFTRYHISTLFPVLHLMILIPVVYISIKMVKDYIHNKDNVSITSDQKVLVIGLSFTFIFTVLELVRSVADGLIDNPGVISKFLLSQDLAPSIIVMLVLSIVLSSTLQMVNGIEKATEKLQLEKVAWIDPLSKIPNRQACSREFDKLIRKGVQDYTIYFFDADNLKRANDVYGHDIGDELITFVAHSVRNTFENYDGFFGRWGGDEFIACVIGSVPPENPIATFKDNVKEGNQYHFFPFRVSVSYGYASSSSASPKGPMEVLEEADSRMYEQKRSSKEGRADNKL